MGDWDTVPLRFAALRFAFGCKHHFWPLRTHAARSPGKLLRTAHNDTPPHVSGSRLPSLHAIVRRVHVKIAATRRCRTSMYSTCTAQSAIRPKSNNITLSPSTTKQFGPPWALTHIQHAMIRTTQGSPPKDRWPRRDRWAYARFSSWLQRWLRLEIPPEVGLPEDGLAVRTGI